MSELKEIKKIKVVALYEETQKQFEHDPNTQNSLFEPRKVKYCPKTNSKSNVRIEGNIKNESCSTT